MRTDIKTLYIDFDGTLVNTIESIVGLYNEDFKYYKNFNYIRWWDIDTWGFEECNCAPPGYIDLYFNQPRFFEKLKFMQWAQWAVKKLSQYYTIKIVSHGYSPNLKQKESYIKEWFPFAEFIGVNLKEYSDKAHIDMSDTKEISNMAKRVAKFEKITYGQFEKDWIDTFNVPELDTATKREIESIYEVINLPARATKFSAGYDFVSPLTFTLNPGETIKIPTGIRCGMNTDWVLMIYPRSGLGFKYQICLANTIGVVDADYYFSNNEGHIFVKLVNRGDKSVHINLGDAFAQGIFMEYGITEDDRVETFRNGGFGSTDKNK